MCRDAISHFATELNIPPLFTGMSRCLGTWVVLHLILCVRPKSQGKFKFQIGLKWCCHVSSAAVPHCSVSSHDCSPHRSSGSASGLKLGDKTANASFFEKYLEHVALFPLLKCLLTGIKIYYFFLIFSCTDSLKWSFPSTFQGTHPFALWRSSYSDYLL